MDFWKLLSAAAFIGVVWLMYQRHLEKKAASTVPTTGTATQTTEQQVAALLNGS